MNELAESILAFLQSDSRVWWALTQASVIAVAAYLLVVVARRVSPAARVTISLLGLLLMVFTPIAALSQVRGWSWGQVIPEPTRMAASIPTSNVDQGFIDIQVNAPELLTTWEKLLVSTSAVFRPQQNAATDTPTSVAEPKVNHNSDYLPLVVLTSLLLCIAYGVTRLVVGFWQIRILRGTASPISDMGLHRDLTGCMKHLGIAHDIPVRETKILASAAVIGWLKPLLLLPPGWEDWTTEERRAVLAHELAHVKRLDFLSTAIGQLAVAFNFYHPLAHVVLRRLRLDQELAADSLASEIVGGQQRYVELLAGLALRQPKVRTPGPCQAFLPPRRMFVRRLEMLRSLPHSTQWLNRCYSAVAMLTLVGIATLATGLRPHIVIAQESALSASGAPASTATVGRPLASFVPEGLCDAVAFVDAQDVMNSPGVQAIKKQADLPSEFELPGHTVVVSDIEQVLFALPAMQLDRRNRGPLMILRSKTHFSRDTPNPQARLLDSRTLAFCDDAEILQLLGLGNGDPNWQKLLDKNADANIRIASKTGWISMFAAQDQGGPTMALAPLWKNVRTLAAGLTLGDDLTLNAQLDASDGKKVSETLTALKWLAQNYLENLPGAMREQGNGDTAQLVMASTAATAGSQFLDSLQIQEEGQQVNLRATLSDSVYPMIAFAMPAISSARTAAHRTQSMNNMKQLMLAMHNYHDAYRHLPPAVVVDPKSGAKRSWRVELLPFLEYADLYEQYRKDEAWDSPANQKVLLQMPQVFAVTGTTGTRATPYQAIVSESGGLTLTKAGKEPGFRDFTDGTSNTVVIAETKLLVPWTKPVDLVADAQTPSLGTVRESDPGIVVGMGDGSVHFISNNIDAQIWQALITRDGGEVNNLRQ